MTSLHLLPQKKKKKIMFLKKRTLMPDNQAKSRLAKDTLLFVGKFGRMTDIPQLHSFGGCNER